ncbi:MAG: radical SAM protein [Elusimicrobia bacterium]|nr:radical SAM protein [Elusimicrobiota bacterium]
MKVLLINPSIRSKVWAGIPELCSRKIFLFPPLGLMYLQAYLHRHTSHRAEIVDALAEDLDDGRLRERIQASAPGLVGITALTHNLVDVAQTARLVKELDPRIRVCLGGPHVHSYPAEAIALPGVDFAVPGDGEAALGELLDALEGRGEVRAVKGILAKDEKGEVAATAERPETADLDSLPFPDRRSNDPSRYFTPATEGSSMTTMITARGCPQRCTFCDTYAHYRPRSTRNIVDEIAECASMGIEEIFFLDDTFNVTARRVLDIAQEILRRGLRVKWGFKARCDQITEELLATVKSAGCTKIHYGVETGTDEGLRRLNKKLTVEQIEATFAQTKRFGIRTIGFFMLGCPHEKTRAEVERTIEFARRLAADYAVFAIFSPYPDTAAYEDGVRSGVLPKGAWEEFIRRPSPERRLPTCWEEHLSKKELAALLQRAHRRFYFRPGKIIKNLFGFHSLAELKRTIAGGLALLQIEFMRDPAGRI